VRLVIVHHHFRTGGVRRVIETAAPQLVAHWPEQVRGVILAGGEAPEGAWLCSFRAALPKTKVSVFVEPAFGYRSELTLPPKELARRVQDGVLNLLRQAGADHPLFWAHNLGLGRNFRLTRELLYTARCCGLRLVAHHHDWWFDNRWQHFAGLQEPGLQKLDALAQALFQTGYGIRHVAINQADAAVLAKHLPGAAGWLPNPVACVAPARERVECARAWLCAQLGEAAPVWLLPCRLLRRKNVAEAILLTRWLRPEAWLVSTGGPSSAEEQAYADRLSAAIQQHGWRVRLGILQGDEAAKPTAPELCAASEAVLLTSLQEGFGLPYLEAAVVERPLLARRLPNLAPDLAVFGFKFPQTYREVLVDPTLFDGQAERARQQQMLRAWRDLMPKAAASLVGLPAWLAGGAAPQPVPFSRLTLTAQLEVLAQPPAHSWARCAPLNPFLSRWRERAASGRLEVSAWPRRAGRWLSGEAFVKRFLEIAEGLPEVLPQRTAAKKLQGEWLRRRLRPEHLYPLLWSLTS
jgi:hypothetical protein